MWLLNKSNQKASARRQMKLKEVRDGILLLPNNEYRLVIETSSINFELKSEKEQDALIDSFQNFLNSLPCSIQILVRVREVAIDSYIDQISQSKKSEKEKIYKEQIDTYCSFIKNLISGNKILSRHFYLVIPYHHTDKTKDFFLIKEQIYLNKHIITKGLEKLGMKVQSLDSLELLDLFYTFYNPMQAKTQELKGQTVQMLMQHNYV